MTVLSIAEIPYENGNIEYRYTRTMSPDGTRWIKNGLFHHFYPDGSLSSEGTYVEGREHGLWTDYHPNGQLAARGLYENGKEVGKWEFWNSDGTPDIENDEV
ncbi:toxin-antitoxin system YwqK family antitoxin [Labrys wisconsinensis]|uniref:Antitoxin component YwqK of YwqJK toxin-antitoxin module n=1 Tax=Labrys wisconsinensis TaxID=425677 RepID=A0ABU0J6B1_9HYPH|nr:hypothetical protein [Labrys wisconsinensis]MDQ0469774.1 antitoxin component YwqK of YwqJK toxin-antitoxin module [Labrys wisconsinensis]